MSEATSGPTTTDSPAPPADESDASPPAATTAPSAPTSDPPSSDPPAPTENPMTQQTGESYEEFVNRLAREGHIDRRKGIRAATDTPPAPSTDEPKSAPKPAPKPPQPKPQNPHWAQRPLFGKRKRGN